MESLPRPSFSLLALFMLLVGIAPRILSRLLALMVLLAAPVGPGTARSVAAPAPTRVRSQAAVGKGAASSARKAPPARMAENIVFPPQSRVIDLSRPPYNAKGDGVTDNTEAIQRALNDHPAQGALLYLPNGVYIIHDTLRWGRDERLTVLQGQSRDRTVLKLPDQRPGFTDAAQPRAMVWTGGTPAQRFRNQIRNCTFDTGHGNPGAIGVRFDASNVGCLRDVLIRSGDGAGVIGLDMSYADDFGPCFVKNLEVRGFDTGIATKYGVNSVVFENVTLRDQRRLGWSNTGQPITVRHLTSVNRVPVLRQEGWGGFFTLLDSTLTGQGEASQHPALDLLAGGMFIRDLTVKGYASALRKTANGETETVKGPVVREWASRRLPGSAAQTLRLPVKETPELPWDDPKTWAVITDYGGKADGQTDDSEALQRAIDSGKTTVCLPSGTVVLKRPIVIRGRVRRLIGCETFLKFPEPMPAGTSIFTVGDSPEPVLVVERFASFFWDNRTASNFIANPTRRTLVLKELGDVDDTSDDHPNGRGTIVSGPGELFVEDVTGRFHLMPGARAWMRYINPETNQDHRNTTLESQWHLKNEGGQLWVLGIKTEGPGPVLAASRGSRSEILGGLMYSSGGARTQDQPAFTLDDSQASIAITEANFSKNAYPSLIRVRKRGKTVFNLAPEQAPGGPGGGMIPMWTTP